MRDRRDGVCDKYKDHPDMSRLREIWNTIPWEAMSGDETDHHSGKVRYVITSLPWRAKWIREWMAVFDQLHLATRFQESGRATAGAFPHLRVRSARHREDQICTQAVPGLPRNFYDEDWLRDQTPRTIRELRIRPEIDLRFSPLLLR